MNRISVFSYNFLDCSCGCSHLNVSGVSRNCYVVTFNKCTCPEYTIHTVFDNKTPDWCIPQRWRSEVEYHEYITSPLWFSKSKKRKEQLGNRCTVCATTVNLNTHHNTYKNLGHEQAEDLTVLCGKHHELFTRLGGMPKWVGFHKGRIFSDKKHCYETNSWLALGFLYTLFENADIFFQTQDPYEQGYSASNLLMNMTSEHLDYAIEKIGKANFVSALPKVGFIVKP